ncbi:MAG TPA: SIS domain-containing protein [Clostridiales bacterium]|nr:SIS domain-containing protein [Clostridiales bacterium]
MIEACIKRYPGLAVCKGDMEKAVEIIIACYENKGKLLICGNGGSSADSEHIVGELMKGFLKKRPISETQRTQMVSNFQPVAGLLNKLQVGLPAIPLPALTGLNSAYCNDVDPEMVYAQSVLALARTEDVFLGISTSGNSKNVVNAAMVARSLNLAVITLTGESGGALRELSDVCIRVPASETYQVQELHLPVYHALCASVEAHFFDE